jgi:RNA polymerase sigma-70 factor (sigma-E family)
VLICDMLLGVGMSDRDRAFAEYFVARSAAMRGTAFLLCGDWHRAEDLVQTAFTKLYVHWNRVASHEALDPYVRKILIRAFIDEGRRSWWRRERPQETPIERPAAPEPADDRLVLLQALARVPPRQRAVLVLRYWQDMSVEETAAALNCSTGTVKSQAARGLDTLRVLISPPVPAERGEAT